MHIRAEAKAKTIEICDRYKGEPSPLMLILSDCQKEFGYIPLEVQEVISAQTGVPTAEIYGVVTFYNFFTLEPKGKYVIGVCTGTACYVKGSQNVSDKIGEILHIKAGETTEDGLFTLDNVRCLGACGIAPAVSINGKVYPKVQLSQVDKILDEYRKKEEA